jgi:hypothetical protein
VDHVPDPLLLRKSGSAGNRTRDLWVCSQELNTGQRAVPQRLVAVFMPSPVEARGTGPVRRTQLHDQPLVALNTDRSAPLLVALPAELCNPIAADPVLFQSTGTGDGHSGTGIGCGLYHVLRFLSSPITDRWGCHSGVAPIPIIR